MTAFQDNFSGRYLKHEASNSSGALEHAKLSGVSAVNLQISLREPSEILCEPVPELYYASLPEPDRLKWWSELRNTEDSRLINLFRPLLLEERSAPVLDLAMRVSLPHLTAWDLPVLENIARFRAPEIKQGAKQAIAAIEEKHGKLPKEISPSEAALWSTWHEADPISNTEIEMKVNAIKTEVYDLCSMAGLALQINPRAKCNQVDISRVDGVLTLLIALRKDRFDQPAETQLIEQYALWSVAKFSVNFDSRRTFLASFVQPFLPINQALPVIMSLRSLSTELSMYRSGLSDLSRAPHLSLKKQAVLGLLSSSALPRNVMPNLKALCGDVMPEVAPLIQPVNPRTAEYLGSLGFIPTHIQRTSMLDQISKTMNLI